MLGRVRTCSLSSLEVLEMERTPSKLLKDDSLSIYEKTLLKLQQGSQRDLTLISEESMNADASSPSMAIFSTNETSVEVNASTESLKRSDHSQSMISSKAEPHGNLSVLYLFSRYKNSRNNNISSSNGSITTPMEDDRSPADTSPGYDPQLQQRCLL